MSNRIAASSIADRVAFTGWAPQTSMFDGLMSRTAEWTQRILAPRDALSPHLCRDLGVAVAARAVILDAEARRLGF